MTQPLLIDRQRAVLRELVEQADARAQAETATATAYQSGRDTAHAEFETLRQQLNERFETEKEAAAVEFRNANQALANRFEADHGGAERAYATARREAAARYESGREKAEAQLAENRWTITTFLEAGKKSATTAREDSERAISAAEKTLRSVRQGSLDLLYSWGRLRELALLGVAPPPTEQADQDPLVTLEQAVEAASQRMEELERLQLPRWFKGNRLLWVLVILIPVVSAAGLLAVQRYESSAAVGLGTLLLGSALWFWLAGRARAQVWQVYEPLLTTLAQGDVAVKRSQELTAARYQQEWKDCTQRCHTDLKRAEKKVKPLLEALENRRDDELDRADAEFKPLLAKIDKRRADDFRHAEEKYQHLLAQSTDRYETELERTEQVHKQRLADLKARHERDWQALADRWNEAMTRLTAESEAVKRISRWLFPDWDAPVWERWAPAQEVPPGMRFGTLAVPLDQVPHGVPADPRLRPNPLPDFSMAAHLPFPTRGSMLFKVGDGGRAEAVQSLQSVMLRFLTAVPPSKARFTIIDPIGLGENFAAFMHLADYDDALVNSRIWTEQRHIEQRLTDLTEHMGNVIQKYLRNQYATIADYNAEAGEVAEPYRILVVANFPTNFTPEAARRLVSIVNSGAGCGVYTLLSVDTRQPFPEGFNLSDLEGQSLNLAWKRDHFQWLDPEFGRFPLQLDAPPSLEFFTRTLHQVGGKARDAKRVEVQFAFVAPPAAEYWAGDSRPGIRVALGRAGATKRQYLQLGKGTAQHALVAGKTGSGKSTLFHALITNLALLYSPDEVEMYLIDFKKGVEFKTYATHALPHARVVAVESEREFGLSVLQRLDAELKQRGERFRNLGVNDLASYRAANGSVPCPRILLIVDEFQEFFTEDDKIAQEAALLLDRLVRQGRAFGLHVLLGSQTLGGAYSLARSTIDQMAVRIALQCSEADAHLILSKDNAAARLLSRPGEAIYNDANGLLEGNDIFQVVWLSDERREELLLHIAGMARERHYVPPQPQIVFEGSVRGEVEQNLLLRKLLEVPGWPPPARAISAWLGEAMAIKDPTAATFRPQSTNNLLILGQQDEAGLALLTVAAVSLAAQHSATAARFYILDGTPTDSSNVGYLARLADVLPHPLRLVGWRDVPAVMTEVADEAARREKDRDVEGPAVYLLVYGLQWFRDLRKQDDDFGFSRRGEERVASPSKQFLTVLREGPAVGVHSLVWCDTLTNAQRSLDRAGLREFEMKVLFQMSTTDSSSLIDTPLASKLGLHHALYATEDRAQPEKFRPYGLPTGDWLAWAGKQLRGRQGK